MSDEPIPIRLLCPMCGELHIDVGEFATKPHHTHACQACGHVWRPAVVNTVGVRFLPGFKNDEAVRAPECTCESWRTEPAYPPDPNCPRHGKPEPECTCVMSARGGLDIDSNCPRHGRAKET
jgi:hypothetical protein